MKQLVVISAVVIFAITATAQTRTGSVRLVNPPQNVKPLPYTAEFSIEQVQTLADGATITHSSTEKSARDADGRTVTMTTRMRPGATDPSDTTTTVRVFDVVAHTNMSWSVPGQKVTVTEIPQPGTSKSSECATSTTGSSTSSSTDGDVPRTRTPVMHEKPQVQQLGTDTILGVEVKGERTIYAIPVGQIGNNEPLTRTIESWHALSPGLRTLTVRSVNDDPQHGKTTKEMTSFNQSEPDPALFQPPSEYQVVKREVGCGGTTSVGTEVPQAQ